jgi:hypothetical protein
MGHILFFLIHNSLTHFVQSEHLIGEKDCKMQHTIGKRHCPSCFLHTPEVLCESALYKTADNYVRAIKILSLYIIRMVHFRHELINTS